MIKIVIIGSGNVAHHMFEAFRNSPIVEVIQVLARNKKLKNSDFFEDKMIFNFSDLAEADLYLIAVSDNAISNIASQLPFENRLVVHTSGAADLAILNSKNRKGVFYPLQTFSKNRKIDYDQIPICLEYEQENDFVLLTKVAHSISNQVFKINYEQRKKLHLSAVFVNNFTNHLYQIGEEICLENNIPFEILNALILETAKKAVRLSPKAAQTGPAVRNDTQTIEAHLSILNNENQKSIYQSITQSIQNNVKKL